MFLDKIVELYREACVHGLPVSLSLSHHNGRESFSFTSIPGPDVAGRPEPRRRSRGGRRRRGRENHGACAGQPTDAAPSYAAVARSPPSPLVSHTAKRPGRLHAAAELDRPARPTMDAAAAAVEAATAAVDAAAANTADDNAAPDVFPTAGAPLHTVAAIDVVPTTFAAAVSLAEEPAAANILHRDGIINAAADVHPRRRRCNPPPLLMQLRGRNQSLRSSSPNIISSPTPSTPPSPLPQLDGCVTSPLNPNVNPLPPSATHKSTQTNPSPTPPPTLINTSTQTIPSPATVDVCTSPTIPNPTPLPDFDYNDDDEIMFNTHVCKVPNCNDCNYFLSRDSSNWPTQFENLRRCSNWVVREGMECPAHFHKRTARCYDLGLFKSPDYPC